MNKYKYIIINSVKNLTRKKIRSFLTILSIVIGVSSVVIINSIAECGKFAVNTELESLGMKGMIITKTGAESKGRLDTQMLEIIKNQPGVEQAMPVTMLYSSLFARSTITDSLIFGIDQNANEIISLKLCHGKGISKGDVNGKKRVCLLDRKMAQTLYKRDNIIGKEIQLFINGKSMDFEVEGIVETGSGLLQGIIGEYVPTLVYIPYTTMQELSGDNSFTQISITIVNEQESEQIGEKLLQVIAEHTGEGSNNYKVDDQMKHRQTLSNLMNIVTLVLSMVGFIAMLVASLGIMTIMLVSVNERTREIGIKKSIGASRGSIRAEFLFEALLLTLTGSLIGVILGLMISYIGAILFGFTFVVNVPIILFTALASIFIGGIFGVYPAIKASRLRPVDALRRE